MGAIKEGDIIHIRRGKDHGGVNYEIIRIDWGKRQVEVAPTNSQRRKEEGAFWVDFKKITRIMIPIDGRE